jgi:hypothetical protein
VVVRRNEQRVAPLGQMVCGTARSRRHNRQPRCRGFSDRGRKSFGHGRRQREDIGGPIETRKLLTFEVTRELDRITHSLVLGIRSNTRGFRPVAHENKTARGLPLHKWQGFNELEDPLPASKRATQRIVDGPLPRST